METPRTKSLTRIHFLSMTIASIACGLFIAWGLSVEVNLSNESGWGYVDWELAGLYALLSLGVVITFSYRMLYKKHYYTVPFSKLPVCIASLLLALCMHLGQSMEVSNSLSLLYSSFYRCLLSCLRLSSLTLFFFLLICIFISFCSSKKCAHEIRKDLINIKWIYLVAIIIACWIPYFIVFYPGSIPTDTSRQLAQYLGPEGAIQLDNHFPYLTSVIFGQLYRLGSFFSSDGSTGVAMLSLFQIALGSAVFGTIIYQINAFTASKCLLILSLLFVALFPLFPTHAVTISKDYLHACLFALFVLQIMIRIKDCIDDNLTLSIAGWPAIFSVALLLCLTRNNGVYIAVPSLVILFFLTRDKTMGVAAACVGCSFVIWQSIILPSLNVAPGETAEMLSVPMQIIARSYNKGYYLPAEEEKLIENNLEVSIEELGSLYDPRISDPVKNVLVPNDKLDTGLILKAAITLARAHPGNALSAVLNTTFGFWYPFDDGSYWPLEGIPYYAAPDDVYGRPDLWFDGCDWIDSWYESHMPATDFLQFLRLDAPPVSFLYRAGSFSWLILIIMTISISLKSNNKTIIMTCIPYIILLLTLIAGPCTSLRYSLPIIYSLPIFMYLIYIIVYDNRNCQLIAQGKMD